MEGLIRQLLTLPQLQELTAGMAGREKHSMVTGLSPVQRAAVAAAAAEQTGRPLLMLCADEQECARQTADLRALTGEEPVVLSAFGSSGSTDGCGRCTVWHRRSPG